VGEALDKLTAKQQKFCREYLVDLNATQAAIRAGYSEKTAYAIGSENLKKPEIVEALIELREELAQRPDIATPEEVLAGYTRDIRFDPRKLYDESGILKDVKDLDDDTALAIAGFEISEKIAESNGGQDTTCFRNFKYKLPDKKANRDSLAKHLGLFVERHALTDTEGKDILGDILDEIKGVTRGLPNRDQRKILE